MDNKTKTPEQRLKEFEAVVRPVIKFLNDNYYPHCTVIIDSMRAELVEGVCGFVTEDYSKD